MSTPAAMPRRPSFLRLASGYLLASLLFVGMFMTLSRYKTSWPSIAADGIPWLVLAAMTCFGNLAVRAIYLAALSRHLGRPLGAPECLYLTAATQLLSAITLPGVGVIFRAAYLRRQHAIPLLSFARGMAFFAGVWLGFSGLVGGAVLIRLLASNASTPLVTFAALGVTAVVGSAWGGSRHRTACSRICPLLSAAIFVAIVCSVTRALGLYAVFRALSVTARVDGVAVMTAAHQLSSIIGLTPGGAGVQEGADLLASTVAGVTVTDAVSALLILRAVGFLVTVAAGGPSWFILTHATETAFAAPAARHGLRDEVDGQRSNSETSGILPMERESDSAIR